MSDMAKKIADAEVKHILLADIIPTPDNPRRKPKVTDQDIKELAESIKKDGQIQEGIARQHPKKKGKYDLRCGARRHTACKVAGLDTMRLKIAELTDEEAMVVTIQENKQREDLSPVEEARGIQLLKDKGDWDIETIASYLGKSEKWVHRRANLANLHPKIILWFENDHNNLDPENEEDIFLNELTIGHLEVLAKLSPDAQVDFVLQKACTDEPWYPGTIKDMESMIEYYMRMLGKAPWKPDEDLLPGEALYCIECPERASNNPGLFDDASNPEDIKKDRCLNPLCWKKKMRAYVDKKEKELKEIHGKAVLVDHSKWSDWSLSDEDQERGVLPDRKITPAKKKDKGSVPAVDVKTGSVTWIIPDGSGSGEKIPTPLSERRDMLNRKRWAETIREFRGPFEDCSQFTREKFKIGHACQGMPVVLIVVTLASEIGTNKRDDCPKPSVWKNLKKVLKEKNVDIAMNEPLNELWDQVMYVIDERLRYAGPITQTPDVLIDDARGVAELFGVDIQAMFDDVSKRKGFTEPKTWAGLNEDGTPKKKGDK